MSAGKLSAQTGHAYESAMTQSAITHPERHANYRDSDGGSKVSLEAKNANALIRAFNQARLDGLPCQIFVDQGHIIPDTRFNGEPIVTALSIGPVTKSESKHITRKFNCIK